MMWLRRLWCRIDGHTWKWTGSETMDGQRIYECERCGVYQLQERRIP